MKKNIIILAALFSFLSMSYAQNNTQPQSTQNQLKTENAVFCPVSGEKVTVAESTPKMEYNGKTYYFCCNNCLEKFKKEPAKYAEKAMMKGKTCASCLCDCCKNGKCDCANDKCDCKDCKCHEKGKCDCKDCNMKKAHKKHKGKACGKCENEKQEIKKEENKPASQDKK
ncbi:MAG: hypothetical protein Fur0012_12480 [Elusimicrobiota bacterium]